MVPSSDKHHYCLYTSRQVLAHTIDLYYQSHLGKAQIQGFAVNYRSIWSLWVVSRVVSDIVANSEAQIQIQLVGCGSHSSLLSFTALCLRAILDLQGNFEAQHSSFGVWFSYLLFFQACIGFLFLSHLFNVKTAYNTQGHIVYVLPYFMTELLLSQMKQSGISLF